jgi:hypothetical protein
VSVDEQLKWEARTSQPTAIFAFGAAVLTLVAFSIQAGWLGGKDIDEQFQIVHANTGRYLAASALDAVAMLLFGIVLYFLFRAVRSRRPELLSVTLPAAAIGVVLYAITRIGGAINFISLSDDFDKYKIPPDVSKITNPQKYLEAVSPLEHAKHLARTGFPVVITYVGAFATLLIASAIVLICFNGMRAGLFSRFMGILGVVVAGLTIFGAGPPPIIFPFWLGALGVLLLGRWPGGRGPAWDSGEAIPWPRMGPQVEEKGEEMKGEEMKAEIAAAETPKQPNPRRAKRKSKKRKRR